MFPTDTTHRYPRLLSLSLTGISVLLTAFAALNAGAAILRWLWGAFGVDRAMAGRVPGLAPLIDWIAGPNLPRAGLLTALPNLLAPLSWFALALLVSLLLRNALPTVRVSSRGLLVEFAGNWLPVGWEHLHTIKVTQDVAGERFVLLTQTSGKALTGWHRLYSVIYGMGWRPGFYITTSINGFDTVVQTILSESERAARSKEGVQAVRLQEDAPSPLFSLFLNPASFFSRRGAAETSAAAPAVRAGGPVQAAYPVRITALVQSAILIVGALAIWRYLSYWARFIALQVPAVRLNPLFSWTYNDPDYRALYEAYRTSGVPFFGVAGFPNLPQPWWLLVAAHLMLVLALLAINWLRGLLPNLETRENGLLVTNLYSKPRLVPWNRVQAFKATEISEQSQVLLLQAHGLPFSQRLNSLLYDGSAATGFLITSAISNYQPLLQSALERLAPLETAGRPPILQQEAASPVLWPALNRRAALAAQVDALRTDDTTRRISTPGLLRAAAPMAALAMLPALLLLAAGLLDGDRAPTFGLFLGAFVLWFFGMLEWPIVALGSLLLDDNTGGGDEGYRALYAYPASQLPRLIPLIAALIFQIVGAPALPALLWVAAIVWAFWLAAALWEALYSWQGTQAILGGLVPVIWQLLLLVGFLIATR
jgi:hypothetical protein